MFQSVVSVQVRLEYEQVGGGGDEAAELAVDDGLLTGGAGHTTEHFRRQKRFDCSVRHGQVGQQLLPTGEDPAGLAPGAGGGGGGRVGGRQQLNRQVDPAQV